MKYNQTDLYDCDVLKVFDDDQSTLRAKLENYGFIIKKKEIGKTYIKYNCLLSSANKAKLMRSEVFRIVREAKKPYNGNVIYIYCDGGVHNYGNEHKSVDLCALTCIIHLNGKEIYRSTKVFDQFLDNNTVELLALLNSLRWLHVSLDELELRHSKIIVSSDSQNLQDCIILPKIIKAISRKCNNDKASNYYSEIMKELLNELNFYLSKYEIYSSWVKGHAQIRYNSSQATLMNYTCDKLCREAIKDKLMEMHISDYQEKARKYKDEMKRKKKIAKVIYKKKGY